MGECDMRKKNSLVLGVLAFGWVSLWAGGGVAEDAAKKGPPVSVGGFSYKYIPTGEIYSFICEAEDCVPGSKVSYQLYPPDKPDFEKYKQTQEQLKSYFRKTPAIGSRVKFGTPRQIDGEHFTVFDSTREQQTPDGGTWFTRSSMLHGKSVTVSLISSSKDEKARDANDARFAAGLIAWGQSLNKEPE